MKKSILALTLGTLCLFAAGISFADEAAQAQAFSEGDVFYNVDAEANYKALAFSDSDAAGVVKCWRWYYRPVYRVYSWRPVYYRPYYCYYRYYCPVYYSYFTWTTVTIYKGGESHGAMLDTDPTQGSPLAAQGLRKGDIITAVDGQSLSSLSDLKRVTAGSKLSVQKGNNVKFAGNLLKNADADYVKGFDGLQEIEAGALLTKNEIASGYDMYKFYDRTNGPALGVKAVENDGNGVKITEVVAGFPGEKSGFEVGDIIVEINGTAITGEQSYSDAIDRAGSVARMKIVDIKTGNTVDADVTLNK